MACSLFMLIGLGTKETAVALPLLAAVAWWNSPRIRTGQLVWTLVPPTLLGLGLVAWGALFVGLPDAYARSLSKHQLQSIVRDLFGSLAAPWSDELLAGLTILGTGSVVVTTMLLLLGLKSWQGERRDWGAVFRMPGAVVVSVIPLIPIFYIGPDLQGSRYLYLSSAFWSIAAALLQSRIWRTERNRRALVVLVAALVLSASTLALRFHLAPWREAALKREEVLSAGAAVLGSTFPEPVRSENDRTRFAVPTFFATTSRMP